MKGVLLDTHALLWWVDDSPRLGAAAHRMIGSANVLVSVATLWEIGIKHGLGKLVLSPALLRPELRRNDFRLLAVEAAHCEKVATLPPHHRDPFDRMLIAQAMVESLTLMTADRAFVSYGIDVVPCT